MEKLRALFFCVMMNCDERLGPRWGRVARGCLLAGAILLLPTAHGANWPGFRGLNQSRIQATELPLKWSTDTRPAWQANLPGTGQSSPTIWGDHVYVTSLEGANKDSLHCLCFSLKSGQEEWRRSWTTSHPEKDSNYVSKAAPTPAADGDRVYVLFESGDVIALTHQGKEVWRRRLAKDYGAFEGNHGQGSSPALSREGVLVLMDHKGTSFLVSLDKATGKTRWKTDRDTSTAWSSPLVLERDGRTEIITSASGMLAAYDPSTGGQLWAYQELNGNNVPSPSTDGSIYLIGSRKKGDNVALKVENQQVSVAWVAKDATSAFGSPLIHQERAYYVSDAGLAYCYRLKSGELLWDARLGDSTWASPLATPERIYFFGKGGKTTVIKPSDQHEILAENQIAVEGKDRVYGYAVADNRLVFRLSSRLVCIAPNH